MRRPPPMVRRQAPHRDRRPLRAKLQPPDAGYTYASNIDSHRLVVLDVCGISDVLPGDGPMDFEAAAAIYNDGANSVNSDGSVRTIGGFASRDDRNPALQDFYGSEAPLNEFITAALEETGLFEGESDAVRRQGVQKGVQNQVMVAWTIHELNAALAKAQDGEFDPAEGAPHNWDEGWAFYHGADGNCGPFSTGNKRAVDFGTIGADGETARANEMILDAMNSGLEALLAEDIDGTEAAVNEAVKGLVIIYSQATLRYAQIMDDDLGEGDREAARVHQAEGYAFFRVMEAYLAEAGADVDAINGVYSLENDPSQGGYATIEEALQPALDSFGITADDIGELP